MNKKLIVMETLIVLLLLTITSLSSMGTYESLVQLNTDNNKIDWVEQVKLNVSDSEEYDYFGLFVSISGNYALIGVFADDNLKGSAYIFKRDGTTWIQDQKLTASDGEENDLFGVSVSLDGDYALIGASSMNGVSGSAYVFKRYGTSWLEETKLTSEGISHYFGRSVSLDGNYALIGVPGDDAFKGSAYVFKRTGTTWNEEAKLTASDGESGDWFGTSVSFNGGYALIGSPMDDTDRGSAYVFVKGDGNQPPDAPAIDGPTSLKINEEGDYTVSTTDLDGDKVYFYIDWDDGTIIDWDGPFLSDQNVHYKKGWIKKNTYIIRVKAQDIYGAESGWTELEVTVTRSKIATNNLMMRFLERFPLLNRLLPLLIK